MKLKELRKICANLSRAGLRKDDNFHTTTGIEGIDLAFSVYVFPVGDKDLGEVYGAYNRHIYEDKSVLWVHEGYSHKHRRASLVVVRGDYSQIEDLEPPSAMDFDPSIPF